MGDEDAIRELTREVAHLSSRQDFFSDRLKILETTAEGVSRTIFRVTWIIVVVLIGQVLSKQVGIAEIASIIKGVL